MMTSNYESKRRMQFGWNELHVFKSKCDFYLKPRANFLLKSLDDSNPLKNNLNFFFKMILRGVKRNQVN